MNSSRQLRAVTSARLDWFHRTHENLEFHRDRPQRHSNRVSFGDKRLLIVWTKESIRSWFQQNRRLHAGTTLAAPSPHLLCFRASSTTLLNRHYIIPKKKSAICMQLILFTLELFYIHLNSHIPTKSIRESAWEKLHRKTDGSVHDAGDAPGAIPIAPP